jgi:uncharacterized damage-inducible protein DinB
MSRIEIDTYVQCWKFNRSKTLQSLEQFEKMPDPQAALLWRPGAGRAHAGWQLMHVAITEELFATARLFGTTPSLADLVDRFRGGSVPDDAPIKFESIRPTLQLARGNLLDSVARFQDLNLDQIPEPIKDRGWTLRTVFQVLAWHEAHHQGQIHITLNLLKACETK